MKSKLLISTLLFSSILAADLQAQEFTKRNRYTTLGVNAMAAGYYGDVTPGPSILSTDPKLIRYNVGIYAQRKFYPNWSARVSLSYGRLRGDDAESAKKFETEDAGRWERNLSFRNDIKELSAVAIYDLKANYNTFFKRPEFTPYIFAGVAVFHHNPKAYYEGNLLETGWYALQPLQTEGVKYSKVQFSIPFGFGARFRLNQNFDLGFEVGWRRTFTDYLDDVSTKYADKGDLNTAHGKEAWVLSDRSIELPDFIDKQTTITGSDGQVYPATYISNAGQQRGDHTRNDWYILTGFTLNYILDQSYKTPKFR
ncbi:DUF6089 family protein [Adhaeribacter terreus]|uniref:DUF6089 family protein n=1 Tax=Adhaeribacter terreus TaxID=529703 RepID=A0ABW0EAD4_9BACT